MKAAAKRKGFKPVPLKANRSPMAKQDRVITSHNVVAILPGSGRRTKP